MKRSRLAVLAVLALSTVAHAQQMPRVVRSQQLEKYWVMMNSSVEARVPNSGRNLDVPGCAAVSFVVEKDGHTSTVKVQKVEPAGDLGRVAASVAGNLYFEPSLTNAGRDRVFSWLIFPFNLPPDPQARTAIMQRCAIDRVDWKDR